MKSLKKKLFLISLITIYHQSLLSYPFPIFNNYWYIINHIYFLKEYRRYHNIYLIPYLFFILRIYRNCTINSINNTLTYDAKPLKIPISKKEKVKK